MQWKCGDKLDYRHDSGKWVGATVIAIDGNHQFTLSLDHYTSHRTASYSANQTRIATYKSRSGSRSETTMNQDLTIGQKVAIQPPPFVIAPYCLQQNGWRVGHIININKKSNQIRVQFRADLDGQDIEFKCWISIDDDQEFTTNHKVLGAATAADCASNRDVDELKLELEQNGNTTDSIAMDIEPLPLLEYDRDPTPDPITTEINDTTTSAMNENRNNGNKPIPLFGAITSNIDDNDTSEFMDFTFFSQSGTSTVSNRLEPITEEEDDCTLPRTPQRMQRTSITVQHQSIAAKSGREVIQIDDNSNESGDGAVPSLKGSPAQSNGLYRVVTSADHNGLEMIEIDSSSNEEDRAADSEYVAVPKDSKPQKSRTKKRGKKRKRKIMKVKKRQIRAPKLSAYNNYGEAFTSDSEEEAESSSSSEEYHPMIHEKKVRRTRRQSVRSNINGNASFQCKECHKRFPSANRLRAHEVSHRDERPFQCPECPHRSKTKHALKAHQVRHSSEKPFGCDFCQKRFKTKQSLKNHMSVHTGEKKYECKWCAAKFRTWYVFDICIQYINVCAHYHINLIRLQGFV